VTLPLVPGQTYASVHATFLTDNVLTLYSAPLGESG
jgi:hypothetical protein